MLKVKTQCTYGRGGEEINDTTRHDYVSLELNTLRVGKKMEIRVVYKHTPFPPPLPPFGHPLLSLSLHSLLLLVLLHLPFLFPSPFLFILLGFFFFTFHLLYGWGWGGGGGVNREKQRRSGRESDVGWKC